MRKEFGFVLLVLGMVTLVQGADIPEHIQAAVAASDRPEVDRARDPDRKPAEVLTFVGIEPGMRVVELMAGSGYYVDILGRAVGEKGTVWAQNNAFVLKRFAEKNLAERLENPNLANVKRLDRELDDPDLPEKLDVVMMVLFYHDTYWQKVDREKMNQAVFAALKPGGLFVVIDHHAEAGSGDRDVSTLHRMDEALVRNELQAVGFQLIAESDILAHHEDERTINVFKAEIRGKTDRFILKFQKPR
jgi:predicted methyltransferase